MDEKYRGNCKFTPGLNCEATPKPCTKCGWNPKVSALRLERIKEARNAVHHGEG